MTSPSFDLGKLAELAGEGHLQLLGDGSYGKVFAIDKNYALKIIPDAETSYAEIDVLSRLSHPNLLSSPQIETSSYHQGGEPYIKGKIVLPRLAKDLASTSLSGLTFENKMYIFHRICSGLLFMHQNGVLHMDLKPGNILVDKKWNPHVADFGLVNYHNSGKNLLQRLVVTAFYRPPEIKSNITSKRPGIIKDLRKVDVWSLGIILCEFLDDDVQAIPKEKDRQQPPSYHLLRKINGGRPFSRSDYDLLIDRPQYAFELREFIKKVILPRLRIEDERYRPMVGKLFDSIFVENEQRITMEGFFQSELFRELEIETPIPGVELPTPPVPPNPLCIDNMSLVNSILEFEEDKVFSEELFLACDLFQRAIPLIHPNYDQEGDKDEITQMYLWACYYIAEKVLTINNRKFSILERQFSRNDELAVNLTAVTTVINTLKGRLYNKNLFNLLETPTQLKEAMKYVTLCNYGSLDLERVAQEIRNKHPGPEKGNKNDFDFFYHLLHKISFASLDKQVKGKFLISLFLLMTEFGQYENIIPAIQILIEIIEKNQLIIEDVEDSRINELLFWIVAKEFSFDSKEVLSILKMSKPGKSTLRDMIVSSIKVGNRNSRKLRHRFSSELASFHADSVQTAFVISYMAIRGEDLSLAELKDELDAFESGDESSRTLEYRQVGLQFLTQLGSDWEIKRLSVRRILEKYQ